MALPDTTPVTSAVQGINWFNFSDPQILSIWVVIILLIILIVKRIWDTYRDISGQRTIEHDGGILTITRINNNAVSEKTLTVANRSYVIDHPAYRIITILGVHLTIWLCDKITGRTIGLNDPAFKSMSANEQNEIIRAIPERELGTVRVDKGITFLLLAIGAGAFLGYILRGFMG
jgi:hypothetical protein